MLLWQRNDRKKILRSFGNEVLALNFLFAVPTSHFHFEHSQNFLCTSYIVLTYFLRTSYVLLTHFLHTSYTLLTHFLYTSYILLTYILHTSYALLTYFLRTSYILLMRFLHTSYVFLWTSCILMNFLQKNYHLRQYKDQAYNNN